MRRVFATSRSHKSIIYINYKLKLHTRRQQDLEVTNSPLHKEPIYITFLAYENYSDFMHIRITDFYVSWKFDLFWLVLVTFGVFGILGFIGFVYYMFCVLYVLCIICFAYYMFCVLYVLRSDLLCVYISGQSKNLLWMIRLNSLCYPTGLKCTVNCYGTF